MFKGPHLADALISSPVIQGEDGTGAVGMGAGGFEFVDPNEDPELALVSAIVFSLFFLFLGIILFFFCFFFLKALRVSMEEQRQRQEDEARRSGNPPASEPAAATAIGGAPASNEDAMLERALAMSMDQPSVTATADSATPAAPVYPDFATMTEEEQIAYAMQMSMAEARKLILCVVMCCFILLDLIFNMLFYSEGPVKTETEAMEVEPTPAATASDDYDEVMKDPEFLQSVLETLPGVDPSSDAVQSAVDALRNQDKDKKQGKKPDSK